MCSNFQLEEHKCLGIQTIIKLYCIPRPAMLCDIVNTSFSFQKGEKGQTTTRLAKVWQEIGYQ